MPARMPRHLVMLLCLAVLAAVAGACGEADVEQGVEEPAREGIAVPLDGVDYNVFITRQLNPRITPDKAYVDADVEQGSDDTLYGVFVQVCNRSDDTHETADRFKIVDSQGNEFEPEELPEDDEFAYHAKELAPNECIPEAGSVAQLGPTAGAMILFRLPLANTEFRPLELEVEGSGDEKLKFELDI
jgi:hypothetical protein